MGLSHCGLNLTASKQELQPHGSIEFPCAGYRALLTERMKDSIPWHWHEEMEILYVRSGALELKIPSKSYLLEVGDCAILNARVLHNASAKVACELDSIVFSPRLIGEESSVFYKKYLSLLVGEKAFEGHLVLSHESNDVCKNFMAAFKALREDEPGYEFTVREGLSKISLYLYTQYQDKLRNQSSPTSQDDLRLRKMLDFLHECYGEDLTLGHIAKMADISERECLRCFKRTINLSPMQYLLKYRVMQAAKMMEEDSTIPISEVARAVGFDSLSYFSKIFKRFYQCTPSQYGRE